MRMIQNGDQQAFETLYGRFSGRMHYFFYQMLARNQASADDQLQELFIKVYERSQQFDVNRSFSTWIYSIARNQCKNLYRDRQEHVSLDAQPETGSQPPHLWAEAHDRAVFDQALTQALNELRETHRSAFVLRHQENLSIQEIADIMETAEGTIKSRLHYASNYLSRRLQAFRPEPEQAVYHVQATEQSTENQ